LILFFTIGLIALFPLIFC